MKRVTKIIFHPNSVVYKAVVYVGVARQTTRFWNNM